MTDFLQEILRDIEQKPNLDKPKGVAVIDAKDVPDFFKEAAAHYEGQVTKGVDAGAAKRSLTTGAGGEPETMLSKFIKRAQGDYYATARATLAEKKKRAEDAARTNTEAQLDYDAKVKHVVAAAVIPGAAAASHKKGNYMKLACVWAPSSDGQEWRDDVLDPNEGLTWERESKFVSGGILHGCATSQAAYQSYLKWFMDAEHDESLGWPFRQEQRGGRNANSTALIVRNDLPGGCEKFAFLHAQESKQEVPPTNEEAKKALEKRRREMLQELRRRRRAEEAPRGAA